MTHSNGHSLHFTGTHPAAGSGQQIGPRSANNQPITGQISTSKTHGTGTLAGYGVAHSDGGGRALSQEQTRSQPHYSGGVDVSP